MCLEMGGGRRRSKMLKKSHKLNSVIGKKPINGCFLKRKCHHHWLRVWVCIKGIRWMLKARTGIGVSWRKGVGRTYTIFFRKQKQREYFPNHSVRPSYPNIKTRQSYYINEKPETNISQEHRCKKAQQNISKSNPLKYTKNYTPQLSGIYSSMQAWSNICKWINAIHT